MDEFFIYGPDVLQKTAIDTYLAARKEDPRNEKLDASSPIMQRAQEHGVRRLVSKSESDLKAKVRQNEGRKDQLQLPSPDSRDEHLASAILTQASSDHAGSANQVALLIEEVNSLTVEFNEDVGVGAIARSGALPMGESGDWLEYAESKLIKDAQLGHQELLWELGSQVVEQKHLDAGGLNTTMERELVDNMTAWFETGGGILRYIEPRLTKEEGYLLHAKEEISPGDSIISVPMKLMMSRVTARNVLIANRGKYLGAELKNTFEKDELWGLSIFLLHEYYKEVAGTGSKWGPFIRSLKVRFLTTDSLAALKGTTAAELSVQWMKSADKFSQWSTGHDGPCNPTTYICRTKPKERTGDNRFSLHQIRWAYWVVKQNAVRVIQAHTGNSYMALIPFYNMFEKRLGSGGNVYLERDNSIQIKVGEPYGGSGSDDPIGMSPGELNDGEFFMRYLTVPEDDNPNNMVKLSLPGTLPSGNPILLCLKNPKEARRNDKCKGGEFRSSSVFWQSETLTKWRKEMNLPPRMTELINVANKLHLFGDDKEERKKMSAANTLGAGLPLSEDVMSHEEQLLLLGLAQDVDDAKAMLKASSTAVSVNVDTASREAPTLYSAPDPSEDPEAKKAMEELATLALQVQTVITSGNIMLNATRSVLNTTRDFFEHGILPESGLDDLDDFLLKKIGMLLHCGYNDDMVIRKGNITKELMCAMRVHLMNETEVHTFCPADARIWNDNCQDVQFMNYTAISVVNEMAVVSAFRGTIGNLLNAYPSTIDEDKEMLRKHHAEEAHLSNTMVGAISVRLREKEVLAETLNFLDDYEAQVRGGEVEFQLEMKQLEREEADKKEDERKAFAKTVQEQAAVRPPVAVLSVDRGEGLSKLNLTLKAGEDLHNTVLAFCKANNVPLGNVPALEEGLRKRVENPTPVQLILGIVNPLGQRKILGIPQATATESNLTQIIKMQTRIFCARYNVTTADACQGIQTRAEERIYSEENGLFTRRVLVHIPIDAPDSRKLQLVVREGEQHDLVQFISDFLEFYDMGNNALNQLVNEVHKRLPPAALQVPVSVPSQRKVVARFAENDNVTAVVEGFINVFEAGDEIKLQLLKIARAGLAPGTYVV